MILIERVCKQTSVIDEGEKIILTHTEKGNYKTMMIETNGFTYWIKEFYSYEKAKTDFYNRVEIREMIENINN